ncbi:diacylglycerol kinase catalytic subunit [Mycobacterium tuberculosis]|nr:diacylglycerol kinase catalytic subunit [Mycobacterium tuberculosis]
MTPSFPRTGVSGHAGAVHPDCRFESGLGVFATTSMKVVPTLRVVRQMFAKQPKFEFNHVINNDDVACLRVTSMGPPIASQFDGDYLGVRETMTFRAVPDALAVVAPPARKRI